MVDGVQAVVLDIGGVFTVPDHRKIADALAAAGIAAPGASQAAVHRAHFVGIRAFERPSHTTERMQLGDWLTYFQFIAQAVGVPDHQLVDACDVLEELLHSNSEKRRHQPSPWSGVIEENVAALRRLHEAGIPLAVVSNNDGTAEDQLRNCGIAQLGDGPLVPMVAIVDSELVGAAKPDPRIFTPALDALGVAPEQALYIGDTPHADVRGARNAGMPVIQLDPFDLYTAWDHHRVRTLHDVADLLAAP
jgi:putative hydrolase of the HAD superfamily